MGVLFCFAHSQSAPEVAESEGISQATLYTWRNQAKQQGVPVPGRDKDRGQVFPCHITYSVLLSREDVARKDLTLLCFLALLSIKLNLQNLV